MIASLCDARPLVAADEVTAATICIGGRKRHRLVIGGTGSLYAADLTVSGLMIAES